MGYLSQVHALLYKEWCQWKRRIWLNLLFIIVPLALMAILLGIGTIEPGWQESGPKYYVNYNGNNTMTAIDVRKSEKFIMGTITNDLDYFESIFGAWEGEFQLGIVTNKSDFAYEVFKYFNQTLNGYVITLDDKDELIKCAAISEFHPKCTEFTTGILFESQGGHEGYKYNIYVDQDYIGQITEGLVDPLQMYFFFYSLF